MAYFMKKAEFDRRKAATKSRIAKGLTTVRTTGQHQTGEFSDDATITVKDPPISLAKYIRGGCFGIWAGAEEGLEESVEQAGGGGLQAVVFEVGVQQVALVDSRLNELAHALVHEIGLADAAHADDDARLAWRGGHADEAGTAYGDGRFVELGNQEVRCGHGPILTAMNG